MTIIDHNGVKLAGPGFHPSQLKLKTKSAGALPKPDVKTRLLAAATDQWQSGRAICYAAGLDCGRKNYSRLKQLVEAGALEIEDHNTGRGNVVRYRRTP